MRTFIEAKMLICDFPLICHLTPTLTDSTLPSLRSHKQRKYFVIFPVKQKTLRPFGDYHVNCIIVFHFSSFLGFFILCFSHRCLSYWTNRDEISALFIRMNMRFLLERSPTVGKYKKRNADN